MPEAVNVAVVGATGAVGETIMALLEERNFPSTTVTPLASKRTAGERIRHRGKELLVRNLEDFDFGDTQLALFTAGAAVSDVHAVRAAGAGCVVVDNTSRFRYDDDVPLVVPEVNPEALEQYRLRNIAANPNCTTIQIVMALKPIHDAVGLERINVCTYQSVSGAGKRGLEELARQTATLLNFGKIEPRVFPRQIAFNAVPHIDEFQDNGYTREEMKIVWEIQKILGADILVNPTAVRIPVFYGHSVALHVETAEALSAADARDLLERAPGVEVVDDPKSQAYPTPVSEAAGRDPVYVGRIRQDISHPRGLNLWVVADNLRKGAALNAVQVAERLVKDYF
ncbi:MAG: aspartate-semialdehyde dehydrogenase [Gammaproteobacteria bacterium]|nr:MAG: aspartate-semialdehyde dehydrogenase [Gammaproteobacteria bacterium]